MLHSGGVVPAMAGKLVVDAVAVVLVLLCLTGFAYWLLPRTCAAATATGGTRKASPMDTSLSLLWHDKLGRTTIILTLWCRYGLVSPSTVMIPLALD